VLDLAGKIDVLNSWVQDAQGMFEKHEGQVLQVWRPGPARAGFHIYVLYCRAPGGWGTG
jgi:hypothetical protein